MKICFHAPGHNTPEADAPGRDTPAGDAPGYETPAVDAPGRGKPAGDAAGYEAPGHACKKVRNSKKKINLHAEFCFSFEFRTLDCDFFSKEPQNSYRFFKIIEFRTKF